MEKRGAYTTIVFFLILAGAWFLLAKNYFDEKNPAADTNGTQIATTTDNLAKENATSTATTTKSSTTSTTSSQKVNLEGYLIMGKNIQSLESCSSHKKYWVTGSAATVKLIDETYGRAVPMRTNNPVYAILYGTIKPASQEKINAGYTKNFEVTKIVKIEATGKCK